MFRRSYFISFSYLKGNEIKQGNGVLRYWFFDYPKTIGDIKWAEKYIKDTLGINDLVITSFSKL